MTVEKKSPPKWLLIVSGLFALLEIMVSFLLCFSPESVAEAVDLGAKGVDFLIYICASRQFALGYIFAFATFIKSLSMLTLAYVFLLVMFLGDLAIGIWQKENSLIMAALFMSIIASVILFSINR